MIILFQLEDLKKSSFHKPFMQITLKDFKSRYIDAIRAADVVKFISNGVSRILKNRNGITS